MNNSTKKNTDAKVKKSCVKEMQKARIRERGGSERNSKEYRKRFNQKISYKKLKVKIKMLLMIKAQFRMQLHIDDQDAAYNA